MSSDRRNRSNNIRPSTTEVSQEHQPSLAWKSRSYADMLRKPAVVKTQGKASLVPSVCTSQMKPVVGNTVVVRGQTSGAFSSQKKGKEHTGEMVACVKESKHSQGRTGGSHFERTRRNDSLVSKHFENSKRLTCASTQQVDLVEREVCSLQYLAPGDKWVNAPKDYVVSVCVQLDRVCRIQKRSVIQGAVQSMLANYRAEGDAIVFTDGSVSHHIRRSAWAFTARSGSKTVHEESGALAVTTTSTTMELIAVTKAMAWLGTERFSRACILSDSLHMLKMVEKGLVRKQWIQHLDSSDLRMIQFMFIPAHVGIKGNHRADFLARKATVSVQ